MVDDSEQLYVDSLRWRRGNLKAKLDEIAADVEALTQQEADLRQQLRAVEQLLSASTPTVLAPEPGAPLDAPSSNGALTLSDPVAPAADFSAWGPTARRIYICAEEVIREAGVPLHYRVLADEIQKKVPLSGVDPGATLIAHLHRAQDAFPRVARGVYGLAGMTSAAGTTTAYTGGETSTPRKRRRKMRRRTR